MPQNDDYLTNLLKSTPIARDSLPYTAEFIQLYDEYKRLIGTAISKNALWKEILKLGKKGGFKGKRKGFAPPVLTNPQITILHKLISYKVSDCDNLVYTTEFDRILEGFNSGTGLILKHYELWKVLSNMRKAKLKDEMLNHLEKAKESACLAVEIYNKPLVKFRSGGYIVLMIIAWTSLFHAIFFKRGTKPFYKNESGKFELIDGDFHAWELSQCLKEYYGGENPSLRLNLEFIIGLRNKIEHRSMPELDLDIFGECQAMLFNFESMLMQEFGEENSIQDNLTLALQFSHSMWKEQTIAIKRLHKPIQKDIQAYVERFRSSLSDNVLSNLEFSYKVFLIPQITNNPKNSASAVEFVHYDPKDESKMKDYNRLIALIKPKTVQVSNQGKLRACDVCKLVLPKLQAIYGQQVKFSPSAHHVRAWKHFKIRPANGSADPTSTDTRYCVYDETHRDYLYSKEWVDFLIKNLSNSDQYLGVIGKMAGFPA